MMTYDNIFTVKNEHLDLLDQNTAVRFFQKLLWAEARSLGIELNKINISSRVNVPDGGIDATVDVDQLTAQNGIIKLGKTSYQIKAGAFSPGQEKVIKKEIFGGRTPLNKENLSEGIQTCLNDNGTYVMVCTGVDLVDSQHRNALNHIRKYFEICCYQNAKVEVWSQNNLISFLESFPSLALWVTGRDRAKFQTHQSWQRNADMQGSYILQESQEELIEKIQNDLRQDGNLAHVQVAGQPGIGKTRLILEATKAKDLCPLVIYCSADQFLQDTFLMNELCNDENQFSAILVIDDCNLYSQSEILAKLRYRHSQIKLITIYNNHEERTGDLSANTPQRLEDDQIRSIIQEYTNTSEVSDPRWVELCSGSPRVAHVIGWNLENHPQNLLNPLSTVNIWENYIVSVDDLSSERIEQRRRVLRYLALFKQFGFEIPVGDEAQAIAQKVEAADPQITWTIFQEIIDNLKKRKILQGESTLVITPKALHIILWIEWWDIYGRTFNLEEFTQGLTEKLVEWFYEMFKYAAESGVASGIVEDFLGPSGPFQKGNYFQTHLGGRFFLALTEANSESALKCLKQTIGKYNQETLLQFTAGRREVIWALEKIAFQKNLFTDAARLLLALGEAENEGYSNNASGVFAKLFSPGPGRAAPTGASPAKRFQVLREAFESDSKERQSLALKACSSALTSEFFSRTGSSEYQGLHRPEFWEPETYGEWWNGYRQVWQFLSEQLAHLSEDERKQGVTILLGHAGAIGRIPTLGDIVVDTVRIITENRYATEKQIIKAISQILFHDDLYADDKGLPTEIRQCFEQLLDELVGSDFHSLMQRYVGMDLPEDQLYKTRNGVDRVQPNLERLAQQAVEGSSLLQSELHWLVTTEAENGYRFGYELGKIDDEFSFLPTLLDAQRNTENNASVSFLGGYFHAVFDINKTEWEKQFDDLKNDTTLNTLIPALTSYSGLTDQAGLRLLELAEKDNIGIDYFESFIPGKGIANLSDEIFTKWINFLLDNSEKLTISIALKLFYFYYIHGGQASTLPYPLIFQLLSHSSLFEESDAYQFDTMTDYYWTEIGKAFLQFYPEKSLEIAELMLAHLGVEGTIVGGFKAETSFILTEITRNHPEQVWERVTKHLETQDNFSRKPSLENWLREAITLIPREKIWEWVDNDAENRALNIICRIAPKTFSTEDWPNSFMRAILVRYGAQKSVRNTLMANHSPTVVSGPVSSYYNAKKQKLLHIKTNEDNESIKRWIDDFVNVLRRDIEVAKVEEERES